MKKINLSVFMIALFISGCGVSNWNIGKTTMQNTKKEEVSKPKEEVNNNKNNYHIDTIINTWGNPTSTRQNSAGNKIYIWENCKPTGAMVDVCDDNGCSTIPEKNCCERALVTDKDGYVQNLKEAVNSCI